MGVVERVGLVEGALVDEADGESEGKALGLAVGRAEGDIVGGVVGLAVGDVEGADEGLKDGDIDVSDKELEQLLIEQIKMTHKYELLKKSDMTPGEAEFIKIFLCSNFLDALKRLLISLERSLLCFDVISDTQHGRE